jgi:Leucine-rich repeat (LRR) protein
VRVIAEKNTFIMRLFLHGRSSASMIMNRLKDALRSNNITCLLLSGWTLSNDENEMMETDTFEVQQALMEFLQDHPGMDEIVLQNCSGNHLKTLIFGILHSSPKALTIRYDKQQNMPSEIACGLVQGMQTRIQKLNLRGITLTPAVMEALQLALPENFPCLEELSVKGNILLQDVDQGVSILGSLDDSSSYYSIEDTSNRFTSLLLELPNLTCLELEYCHLEDSQLALLLNAALSSSDIHTIKLRGNQCQGKTMSVLGRHLVCNSCTLETLDLTWQRLPVNESSSSGRIGKKKSVYQANTAFEGVPLLAKALTKNSSLRNLILSENKLSDMDMDILALSLEVNKTLERLELKDCRLSSDSLFCLARSLPKMHLRFLHIDGIQKMCHHDEEKTLKSLFLVPLTKNVYLHDLSMNCQSPTIERILELNRAGRHGLVESDIPAQPCSSEPITFIGKSRQSLTKPFVTQAIAATALSTYSKTALWIR